MKKILIIANIILLGFIYSCERRVEEEPYIIPAKTRTSYNDVSIVRISDIYGYFPPSLEISFFDHSTLPYVNVGDYINIVNSFHPDLLLEVEVNAHELIIKHESYIIEQESFIYQAVLNAEINEVYFESGFFGQIDWIYKSHYTNLTIEHYERIDNDGVSINLNDYEFTIEQDDNDFYLPFHLAVLFFNQIHVHTVYNYDTIYFTFVTEGLHLPSTALKNHEVPVDILEATYNFLRLFFDYYYGLSDFLGITGEMYLAPFYEPLMNPNTHYSAMRDLFTHLDDIHTRHLESGLYLDETDYTLPYPDYINRERRLTREAAVEDFSDYCQNRRVGVTKIGEHTAQIHIKGFYSDTGTVIKRYLDQLALDDAIENIILDLTCSPGGSASGMLETLTMMTSEEIIVRRLNAIDGSYSNLTIKSNYHHSKTYNWFVKTSPYTFSAANIVASIASEQGLATLIGLSTSGGASSRIRGTTPSGQTFFYSSYNHFVTLDNQSMELSPNIDIHLEFDDWRNTELILSLIK